VQRRHPTGDRGFGRRRPSAAPSTGIDALLAGEKRDLGDIAIDDERQCGLQQSVYAIARTIPRARP